MSDDMIFYINRYTGTIHLTSSCASRDGHTYHIEKVLRKLDGMDKKKFCKTCMAEYRNKTEQVTLNSNDFKDLWGKNIF